jgi:hypothetical protein
LQLGSLLVPRPSVQRHKSSQCQGYRVRAPRARIRLMPATRLNHQPSTRNNSTTIAPIDDAIAAIDARKSVDDLTLTEIADKFSVD